MPWSLEEIAFIHALRENQNAPSWLEITRQVNAKFGRNSTPDSVRKAEARWEFMEKATLKDTSVQKAKVARSAQKTSAINARTLKNVLDAHEFKDDVLELIKEIVSGIGKTKPPKPPKKYPSKFNMTMELMLTDLHFGKLVKSGDDIVFNEKIARRRMREIASVFLKELHMAQKHYNVEKIIIFLGGDLIESFEMHLLESARGCEYTTSRQIWAAIDSILNDVLIPLAETGMEIEIPCVTGNHDRSESKKTYVDPGFNNWTFIIYKTLEAMMAARGYKNVHFQIPSTAYCFIEVYGQVVLYEHYDEAGSNSQKGIGELMRKRSQQLGRIVKMARGGHYHTYSMYDGIIVNGSLAGTDSFANTKGFYPSGPVQALNFYLDYEGRGDKTPFHKTFGIKLD